MAAFALMLTIAAPTTADAQGRAERQFFRALGVGAAVVGGALLFGAAARAHLDPRYHSWAPVEGYYYFDGPRYYGGAAGRLPERFLGLPGQPLAASLMAIRAGSARREATTPTLRLSPLNEASLRETAAFRAAVLLFVPVQFRADLPRM
jgi:hypothetical protein